MNTSTNAAPRKDHIEALHGVLLEFYIQVDTASRAAGVPLIFGGGTMLGAVRHQGFIPWDDDMDLMVTRDKLNDFLTAMKHVPGMYIEYVDTNDLYPLTFIKLRKIGTELVEKSTVDYPTGKEVFIDVFVIENAPDGKLKQFIHGTQCTIIKRINQWSASSVYQSSVRSSNDPKSIIKKVIGALTSFRTPNQWARTAVKVYGKYQKNENSRFVTIPCGRAGYFGELYPREYFSELQSYKFESHEGFGTKNYEGYLTALYGNSFMEIPPVEKREDHEIISFKVDLDS